MPKEIVNECKEMGVTPHSTTKLDKVTKDADVLYVTRVQKERFVDLAQYEEVKDHYVITPEIMKRAKDKMIVMHPLPRVGEIHRMTVHDQLDRDPAIMAHRDASESNVSAGSSLHPPLARQADVGNAG